MINKKVVLTRSNSNINSNSIEVKEEVATETEEEIEVASEVEETEVTERTEEAAMAIVEVAVVVTSNEVEVEVAPSINPEMIEVIMLQVEMMMQMKIRCMSIMKGKILTKKETQSERRSTPDIKSMYQRRGKMTNKDKIQANSIQVNKISKMTNKKTLEDPEKGVNKITTEAEVEVEEVAEAATNSKVVTIMVVIVSSIKEERETTTEKAQTLRQLVTALRVVNSNNTDSPMAEAVEVATTTRVEIDPVTTTTEEKKPAIKIAHPTNRTIKERNRSSPESNRMSHLNSSKIKLLQLHLQDQLEMRRDSNLKKSNNNHQKLQLQLLNKKLIPRKVQQQEASQSSKTCLLLWLIELFELVRTTMF